MTQEEKPKEKFKLGWVTLTSAFIRTFFIQVVWNFERYLSYGFAFILIPVLKRTCPPEERGQALARHMDYFNTHPYMASFLLGAVIRMEEDKYSEPRYKHKLRDEEISALKVGMMGPLAGMGDNLFWATLRPYCGLIAITLVLSHAFQFRGRFWIVPLLYLLVFNVVHVGIRLLGFIQGYNKGDQVVLSLRRYGFQDAIRGLKVASLLLLSVLIVMVNLSDLDKEPGLFALKLTFFGAIVGLFSFALHRKISPSQMFYTVVLFALMLAFWPDLSSPPAMGGLSPGVSNANPPAMMK